MRPPPPAPELEVSVFEGTLPPFADMTPAPDNEPEAIHILPPEPPAFLLFIVPG